MTPTTYIERRFSFDAAHRVMRHESKCSTLHGHRYEVLITCTASDLDGCNRVIDFGVIKDRVGWWIDTSLDHTTILNAEDTALLTYLQGEALNEGKRAPYIIHGEPTAEMIAAEILAHARDLLNDARVHVVKVKVYETANCAAEVTRLGPRQVPSERIT